MKDYSEFETHQNTACRKWARHFKDKRQGPCFLVAVLPFLPTEERNEFEMNVSCKETNINCSLEKQHKGT